MASFPNMQPDVKVGLPKAWTAAGYFLLAGTAIFVTRIVHEETTLTWLRGTQMVGFAMVHGALPFVLAVGILCLPGGLLWLAVSLVLLVRRRFRVLIADWIPIALIPLLMMLLFVPYEAWEELRVRIAGPGAYGNDYLVQAAGHDRRRFVTLLLDEGYDINYEDRGGTTPLSGTSVGGHEDMVNFLVSKGADVNRKDRLIGETPLMAAAGMGQLGTAKALLKNGADPCATDNQGHTAEGLARKYRHDDIAEYLSSRFHCQEHVIIVPCVDSAVSVCVHP